MSESLLRSDADFEDVLQRLLHVVATVPLPTPGHQAAWLAATSAADPVGVFDQARYGDASSAGRRNRR